MDDNKFSDIEISLSNKELEKIKSLNKTSNSLRKKIKNDNGLMNMNIKEIIHIWAKNNIELLVDLTNFFSNLKKYQKYFDDTDESSQWFKGLKLMFSELIQVFFKGKRIIFIGMTLILLSFGMYIIQITS